ncbi:flagella synthesis protein FlgN [Salinisphaera sp. Q1T1-3]|uniref:flagella synthesis protein FlgN n=1 Tax=Salinisphaera sp. Q1T1-3 TaxID=2321229 RepID=UPI000E755660|nr:flagellar protein FlgN [Salinisphaera sp. Q1T1-3]RJS95177.1 flagellar protein FlgN [Salinisphaera sp. Q1T1-3]
MTLAADYAAHLTRQDIAVQAFLDVLERERVALAARPVVYAALAEATEAKTQQIAALETMERERGHLIAAALKADEQVSDADMAARLGCSELWADLSERVARARNQNAINGMAIQNRLDYTETRLAFVRRNVSGSLYAPDGRRQAGGTGRSLGGA